VIQPIQRAGDPTLFGGKAAQLGSAARAGLPVPCAFALSWMFVETVAVDEHALRSCCESLCDSLCTPIAVRSSAVGEDSAGASFAGQHETRLGVHDAETLAAAILAVRASAFTFSALAYRTRLGVDAPPRMAVVVQELIDAECAGVMFTRNPLDGSDERVIEAAWGLGEAVVAGLVTPDRYRIARDGTVLERRPGEKDLALRSVPGGVRQESVDPELVFAHCLDLERLRTLHTLALRCEEAFGGELDLEWAFRGDTVHLLQHRPITRNRPA
jgi:pyruvate,water dikinase